MYQVIASTRIDGEEVRKGDHVGFKADVEQSGKVKEIRDYGYPVGVRLVLTNEYGFSGGYIGGQTETEERASDCWTD